MCLEDTFMFEFNDEVDQSRIEDHARMISEVSESGKGD